jgi:hypothetical protein
MATTSIRIEKARPLLDNGGEMALGRNIGCAEVVERLSCSITSGIRRQKAFGPMGCIQENKDRNLGEDETPNHAATSVNG